MSAKHLSDDAASLVQTALRSLTLTNPSVAFDETQKTIFYRPSVTSKNVAIVSGGGSGHEPAFAGFVGKGLLSGAVAGSIFASPSAEQVYRCLMRLGKQRRDRGILVIIMNYTGDVLHFGMAVEKARAAGIECELLIVGDDVGVGRTRSGKVGRRGLAGTVLVEKIAGGLAIQGRPLSEVYSTAKLVAENIATVGASLSHVHVPGRAKDADELISNDEIEIGMGIHNEEGFGRVKTNLSGLVKTMLAQLLDLSDKERGFLELNRGDDTALLVNNLGGLSQLEVGAVVNEVSQQLGCTYGLHPKRILSGTYMSSLNGLGFSVTLLKVAKSEWLDLIDLPVEAAGWTSSVNPSEGVSQEAEEDVSSDSTGREIVPSNFRLDPAQVQTVLTRALENVIAAEPEVTKYDTLVGDGDCGLCLKTCALAVQDYMNKSPAALGDAVNLLEELALVVEGNMDGTSGALYAIFINALAGAVRQQSNGCKGVLQLTVPVWADALDAALKALGHYTPARPGDRTLVDALDPFVVSLKETADVATAVKAATQGCESTKGMVASLGRSVYVGGEEFKNCPDPGAYGLVKLLEGFLP